MLQVRFEPDGNLDLIERRVVRRPPVRRGRNLAAPAYLPPELEIVDEMAQAGENGLPIGEAAAAALS